MRNRFRKCLFAALVLPVLLTAAADCPFAGFDDDGIPDFLEERDSRALVADVIDIQIVDDKVLAIQEGQSVLTETLELDEEVLWKGTRGLVGLVVTTERLLAVSTFTSNWVGEPLHIGEIKNRTPRPFISDFLILVVTGTRLLGFDSERNNWVETDISLYDKVVRTEIDRNVAVVVLKSRAWGFAKGSPFFDPVDFMKGEKVLSVETSPLNVNILTNKRLLVFKAVVGVWESVDKDLY